MEFIEKKEVTNTTYEAQNEQYRYSAEVTTHSGSVIAVTMNAFQKLQDGREVHAGYFALRDSNKSMSIPESQPVMTHTQVFEDFLSSLQVEEPEEDQEPEEESESEEEGVME